MIENERPCVEIAQQLFAVERAIAEAKGALIQEHTDYCLHAALDNWESAAVVRLEFKEIIKYL